MVDDYTLFRSEGHKVKLIDCYGNKRIATVDLYESPYDSDSDDGYSGIGVDDGIIPNYLYQDEIESIEILD